MLKMSAQTVDFAIIDRFKSIILFIIYRRIAGEYTKCKDKIISDISAVGTARAAVDRYN